MRENKVKNFFEQTDVYLTYNYNLRIRMETVGYYLKEGRFKNVLDMPCGTGDISIPYLPQFERLTLMDFSTNMVKLAESKVGEEDKHRVKFVNSDFYDYNFGSEQYDLIISLGILAHINEPYRFLKEIYDLLPPGGYLILQNTDDDHWFTKLIRTYLGFRRLIGKDKYKLNKVSEIELLQELRSLGFEVRDVFRYNQSFLGFSRVFSNNLKYKLTRDYFGYAGMNKNARQGSDCTYLLQKK